MAPPNSAAESVWDYPRPPRLERSDLLAEVEVSGRLIASSTRSLRVLETSHPPVHYLPPEDVAMEFLTRNARTSFCEWKGRAVYYDLRLPDRTLVDVAWAYPKPVASFADLAHHLAFYPSKVDQCRLGGETVEAQEGDFYGGWITSWIVGPFKGAPGTAGW